MVYLYDQSRRDWRQVEAEPIDVAPHLSAQFVLHECPWSKRERLWKVSEAQSGCCIARFGIGFLTKEDAIQQARERLSKIDEAGIQRSIATARATQPRRPDEAFEPAEINEDR